VQIVPKRKLSNEWVIAVLMQKFQRHQPVYRPCAVLAEEQDILLSRTTLNPSVLAAGQLLIPVVGAQARELLAGHYVQAGETPVPWQTAEQTGRNQRAYIWESSVPGGGVVFDFRMSRGRAGPKEFLRGFRGTLPCDACSAYQPVEKLQSAA